MHFLCEQQYVCKDIVSVFFILFFTSINIQELFQNIFRSFLKVNVYVFIIFMEFVDP